MFLAGTATLGVALIAAPTQASVDGLELARRALPAGSIKHAENRNWTWFGPSNWTAAYGTYGISIFGPNKQMVDYGFSSTVCSNGATAAASARNYFAGQRAQLRRSGVKRIKLKVGTIKNLPAASYGLNYFRQTVQLSGRSAGSNIRGEVVYDYSAANGTLYCSTRSQSRVAKAAGYARTIKQLRSIQATLAYFGPGA